MIGRAILNSRTGLREALKRTKIEYNSGNAYNKRWQYKWKHAYTTSEPIIEPTKVKTPEDAPATPQMYGNWIQDWTRRVIPGLKVAFNRRHRMYDNVSLYVLPGLFAFNSVFQDVAFGFWLMKWVAFWTLYTRIRDKTLDPDFKEAYLREMIYTHPEIAPLFKDASIHVLDYDFEYDRGFPCEKEFPEFTNKMFRFFNTDTSMCTGHFVFGDLESGATMTLRFKTMPVAGKFRFQIGEPFFFYEMIAEINHKGEYKEVVIVDKAESLKKYRPFLIMF